MRTTKRADGWWIVDLPPYRVGDETFTDYGPYKTRDEADADLAGLTRFYRDHPEYAGSTVPTPDSVPEPVADAPSPAGSVQAADSRLTQRMLFGAER